MIEDEKVIYYLTIALSVVQRGSMFLNDISTLETEQLIIPEKLGSGENRGDFDYPAEKVRYLWFTSSRKDNAGCGRVYCGVYRCRCMPH